MSTLQLARIKLKMEAMNQTINRIEQYQYFGKLFYPLKLQSGPHHVLYHLFSVTEAEKYALSHVLYIFFGVIEQIDLVLTLGCHNISVWWIYYWLYGMFSCTLLLNMK